MKGRNTSRTIGSNEIQQYLNLYGYLCVMRKNLALIAAFSLVMGLLLPATAAVAMGSGNPYLDAQTGLSYQILQPGTTGDLLLRSFKLLSCGKNQEQWLAAIYGEDRSIQFLETDVAAKCSNPGLGVKVATATINGFRANIVVFCDPAIAKQWKNCKTSDLPNYGGYAMWNTKPTKLFHGTSVEVLVSGITYSNLLKISRAMKPVTKG